MTRDFKLKPGEEILIQLSGSIESQTKPKARSSQLRGIVQGSREIEFLARRRKKSAAFINFYDLGEYREGDVWNDDTFAFVPDPSLIDEFWVFPPNLRTDYNKCFDNFPDPAAWKDSFRKFTYADAYRYHVNFVGDGMPLSVDNENWVEGKGYKMPPAGAATPEDFFSWVNGLKDGQAVWFDQSDYVSSPNFEIYGSGLFAGFFSPRISDDYKVTNEASFTAPAASSVTIDLGKNLDVYLNRSIMKLGAFKYSNSYPEQPIAALNMFFAAVPRFISHYSEFNIKRENNSPGFIADFIGAMQEFDETRKFTVTPDGLGGNIYTPDSSPGDFYQPDSSHFYVAKKFGNLHFVGSIYGALNQGNKWYYFWRT